MGNKTAKPTPEKVLKPYMTGSFCGRDAWKLVPKRFLSVLGISLLYFLGAALMSFESLIGRILPMLLVVGVAVYYQFARGMAQGANDTAYGEMMYARAQEGKQVPETDRERCFHRFKGFFTALMGALPMVLVACVYAVVARPETYALGALPSWTQQLMAQSEFGDALRYYEDTASFGAMEILRIIVRAATMPFINVAVYVGRDATLWAERLSPLFILLAPLGYGAGYLLGPEERVKINTGIKMGDDKKRRKERKARKQRQRSRAPERLI